MFNKIFVCLVFALGATTAFAEDLEGVVEATLPDTQSFVLHGITFYTTKDTDYDDGLKSYDDLKPGQTVEVDFIYRDGKHYATEVELEKR
jgi:hypothetical protein